jgi:hypothetical protein
MFKHGAKWANAAMDLKT